MELFHYSLHAVLFDRDERLSIHTRRPLVALDSLPRFPQDVTPVDAVVQRVEPSLRGPLGRGPQPALELSHFVRWLPPPGGIGPDLLPGHALALTSASATTTAGASPSGRVLLHGLHRYYGPLGLPLPTPRLPHRLIRAGLP